MLWKYWNLLETGSWDSQCIRRSGDADTVQGAWSGFLNLFYGWSWTWVNLCLFACASCWVLIKPLLLPFPHRSLPCQLSTLPAGKRWNLISIVTFKATKLQSHVGVANWIDVLSLKIRWLMRKTPKQMKKRIFSYSFLDPLLFEEEMRKSKANRLKKNALEAQTRRMRTKPWTRWSSCWSCKARPAGRGCRRSRWRTRCWEPCGGTRGTDGSSAAAAKRCTSSARSSQNSTAHCSATRRSMPRCAPRRRRIQSWRSTATSTRSSVCGCSRRASSGGDGTVEGWDKTVRSVVLTWSHLNSTAAIFLTDCFLTANVFPTSFFLFWWISATLEGYFREVGDLCELHNDFVKFGWMLILPHIVSLIQVLMDDSIFALTPGHFYPQSVEVSQSCL